MISEHVTLGERNYKIVHLFKSEITYLPMVSGICQKVFKYHFYKKLKDQLVIIKYFKGPYRLLISLLISLKVG